MLTFLNIPSNGQKLRKKIFSQARIYSVNYVFFVDILIIIV